MSDLPSDYKPPSPDSLPVRPEGSAATDTANTALSHTMYRIKDPRISIPFYTQTLGMTLVHRSDSEGGKFTNYFLLFPQSPIPSDVSAKATWLWNQQGILELCHNWGTESDPAFKHCSGNEKEHKGFGHICVLVDNLDAACERYERLGVKFNKKPNDGRMKGLAFILDPDGYWIEVIPRGGRKEEGAGS